MLYWKKIFNGIAGGIMIALGGSIYLACYADYLKTGLPTSKYLGAFFFSVGFLKEKWGYFNKI